MLFKAYARNFRGFRKINIDFEDVNFVTGDNSSGKSSLLYLADCVTSKQFVTEYDILGSSPKLVNTLDVLSPYIDSSQTTVGFMLGENYYEENVSSFSDLMGRVITFQAIGNKKSFEIERVLSFNKKNAVAFRKSGKKILGKKITTNKNSNTASLLLKEHLQPSRGYRHKKLPISGTDLGHLEWEFVHWEFDREKNAISMPYSMRGDAFRKAFFGPIRMHPQNFYSNTNSPDRITGAHIPKALQRLYETSSERSLQIQTKINEFGKKSGLFDELIVRPYKYGDIRSPIKIEIKKGNNAFSIDEVGYGISQILPIISDAIIHSDNDSSLLIIQQPELHLHPRAQAAFGELVFDLAKTGAKFIIETHSDFLIDRYRYCLYRQSEKIFSSKIIFCENKSTGNYATEIGIGSSGEVVDPPEKYREFFYKEEDTLFEMI